MRLSRYSGVFLPFCRAIPHAASRFRWLVLVACLTWTATAFAHEIPARVMVRVFVHADASAVRVLVRVPMAAMRDVEFPLRGADGMLDVARADSTLRDAAQLWVADAVRLTVNGTSQPPGRVVAVRAALPSDRAFDSYQDALQAVQGAPMSVDTDVVATQAMLDVLLAFPAAGPDARLALAAQFRHLGVKTTTVVRLVRDDGTERAFMYDGDEQLLQLEPGWWHAAGRFVRLGATHLLDGVDHLLFLLCLVLPVRRLRPLIGVVTAFTVAHSITLGASALGYVPDALWFPPLVELLIAASIVYMAVENILAVNLVHRWRMAFGFGLVHGLGFAYVLKSSLQFAGGHQVTALAAFNIGIEAGQLLVLAVAVPALGWLFRHLVAERAGVMIFSVMIAHTAWHWMTDRFDLVRAYRLAWPAWDAALALAAVRVAIVLLVASVAAWVLNGIMDRFAKPRASRTALMMAGMLFGSAFLAGTPLLAQTAARSTMRGVYTADQATKGREVFAGACSGCHTVASHSGAVFAARWMGRPLSEFFDYVSNLMPKAAPATLTEDEYVWVTAYVLKLNGMPAGQKELSAEPSLLKGIRIDSSRVAAGTGRATVHYAHGRAFDRVRTEKP